MEILWLAVCFIAGAMMAWLYFDRRYKSQGSERVAELLEDSQTAEQALAFEKQSHQATQQTLSDTRERLCEQLKQAKAESQALTELSAKHIADLQMRLRQQHVGIKQLAAELAALRAEAEDRSRADVPDPETGVVRLETVAASVNGSPDDLTKIKGIGETLKAKLVGLEITSFRQLAEFTPADIDRVDALPGFAGRIKRERWVEQARAIVHEPR